MRTVEDYLSLLKRELKGSDPAVVQDALADAEEHLRAALRYIAEESPEKTTIEALTEAVRKYGDPGETAAAYRILEARFPPALAPRRRNGPKPWYFQFFRVFSEPRAWGSFLYMLLSAITGVIYGTWALVGGTTALISMVMVVGIPLSGLFLLSVRGLVLMDGRLVEALLGVRMPHRPLFLDRHIDLLDRLKALFTDGRTWKALIYLILQFPLGFIYLFLSAGLLTLALSFAAAPALELIFHIPLDLYGTDRFTPIWMLPIVCIGGIGLLTGTLHLAGWIGRFHARYARAMLITRQGEDHHVSID